MPFPPEGFVAVAKDLKNLQLPTSEGRYRTVAGRAYYGAYWAVCVAVCKTHNINPPKNLPHEALCQTLAGTRQDPQVRLLGTLLDGLRLLRVHADYRLSESLAEYEADDSVVDAQKAIDMLPLVESRLPKIDPAA